MIAEAGGPFINVDRLDLRKYASRPMLARALCDYIVYNDHNMKKALELCALATQVWAGPCYAPKAVCPLLSLQPMSPLNVITRKSRDVRRAMTSATGGGRPVWASVTTSSAS